MNRSAVTNFSDDLVLGGATGFLVGTRVRTEHGERSVETLCEGDRIITRHGKLATVKAVEPEDMPAKEAPVMISKGALGGGLPRRDVLMAPDQNILLADPLLERLFDCATAVVAARDLMGLDGVEALATITPLAYVQVHCDAPEVLFCSGLACVSYSGAQEFSKAPRLDKTQTEVYLSNL